MFKSTHIRLANRVASRIGIDIDSEEATHLRRGSVAPDEWMDFPHHYGRRSDIKRRILESRKEMLRGDKNQACFNLGVAFHYLADKWTSTRGSDPLHSRWERRMEKSTFVDDVNQMVKVSIPDKDRYYSFLQNLNPKPVGKDETLRLGQMSRPEGIDLVKLKRVSPSTWSTPSVDLNIAYKVCLGVAESVFSQVTPPHNILMKLEEAGARLEKTATKLFYFAWFLSFVVMLFGVVLFFDSSYCWLCIPLLMLDIGLCILSLPMFPRQRFSKFKNVRHLCSRIVPWQILTVPLPFIIVYARTICMCLFSCVLGLLIQWCLSFRLYYGSGANKMCTYVSWYNEQDSS